MILLVRHAPTGLTGSRFCGTTDPPLDVTGIASAERLAAELGRVVRPLGDHGPTSPRVRVVTSPLRRAHATAWTIAQALRPLAEVEGPVVDARLRETDFGVAEGRTWDELQGLDRDLAGRLLAGEHAIDWPGGEPHGDLVARTLAAWADLAAVQAANQGLHLVAVTHGGPLRILLAHLRSEPLGTVPSPAPASWVDATLLAGAGSA